MAEYIHRVTEPVIRNYFQLNQVAITGILGCGKTFFWQKEVLPIAQPRNFFICQVDRTALSPIGIFQAIAKVIESPNFDKAFKAYKRQIELVSEQVWLDNLKAVAGLFDALAIFLPALLPTQPHIGIAIAVGSKALPPEVFAKLAKSVACRTRRDLSILVNNPIGYLAEELCKDLAKIDHNKPAVVFLDDFEFLEPMLREWLPKFVNASVFVTWIVAMWAESLPEWFARDEEDRVLRLDKERLSNNDVFRVWQSISHLEHTQADATQAESMRLPFGGRVIKPDFALITSEERFWDDYLRFQEPPTFGLPIFLHSFLISPESEGCWKPMLEHLKSWLQFEFADQAQDVLDDLILCATARYLDEGIVGCVTNKPKLWASLERTPLLVERKICGERKRAFDERLRSILTHELHRKNPSAYHESHDRLVDYFTRLSQYQKTLKLEAWYHKLLCSDYTKLLPSFLDRFFDILWGNRSDISLEDVIAILNDLSLENPSTRYLREWRAPLEEALDAYLRRDSDKIPEGVGALHSKIIDRGYIDSLAKRNRKRVVKEHEQYLSEQQGR